jgi:ribosomal protein S27E
VIEPEKRAEPAPVKVTCPDCGHVRVAPTDVRLVVTESPGGSFYMFTCPGCDQRVRREVTRDVAGALLARRVPAVRSVGGA